MVSNKYQNNQSTVDFSSFGECFYAVSSNSCFRAKRLFVQRILPAFVFLVFGITARSQTTSYYWVGGASGAWNTGSNWNTALDGSGTQRTTAAATDILIFDGANIGGASAATGTVTPSITNNITDVGQLILQNGAQLVLERGGTGSTTGTFTVGGDQNGSPDFSIDATSSLLLTSVTSGLGLQVILGSTAGSPATGAVYGTVSIIDAGLATNGLIVSNANATDSLWFESGSQCFTNITSSSSKYPFGSNTSSPDAATQGVVFLSGSTLTYQGGTSIFTTSTSTVPPVQFRHGSTMIFQASYPAAIGSTGTNASGMFNSRTYSNVIVEPSASGAATTVTVDGGFYNIDNLTINPNATFLLYTGVAPIAGSIVNNGTFGAATPTGSSNLLFDGNGEPQSIGGSGTFNALGALSVATNANVTLNTNLTLEGTATPNVTGSLNMQSYTIAATSAQGFQFRSPQSPYTLTTDTIKAGSGSTASSNTVTIPNYSSYSSYITAGLQVTGTNIPDSTYIIGTSSSNGTITLSQEPTAGYALSVTLTGNAPACITSSASGISGNITGAGTKLSLGSGTNYVFNAATTTPFPASGFSNPAGKVTANANITSNVATTLTVDTLALNNSVFSIPAGDTVKIAAGGGLSGTFGSGNYIATLVDNTGGGEGIFEYAGITGSTLLPVGSASNYLPVTLNPTSGSGDFSVNVFQGITANALPNGAAAANADSAVNAVWSINGNGTCGVTLGWTAALQGSAFATAANCGISTYDGVTPWSQTLTGTGTVASKTVTATFSSPSSTAPYSVWAIPVATGTVYDTACGSYTFHNTVYSKSGTYTFDTLTTAGEDSIVTLILTINQPTDSTVTATAIGPYTFHGTSYSTGGTYTFDTLNVAGCDSIITLKLTISLPTDSTVYATACGSYTFHNTVYSKSGTYTFDTLTTAGEDSIVTLILTINQPTSSTVYDTACISYSFHGTSYSAGGTYTFDTLNVAGCDSTVTLYLTINQPTSSTVYDTACTSYNFNGTILNTSGTYSATLTNAAGCDSTVTLHLIINQPTSSTMYDTACVSYSFHGTSYSAGGTYTFDTLNAAGCDSTVTLHLIINQPTSSTVYDTACASYNFNGTILNTGGTYSATLTNKAGCDSTVTLHLIINQPTSSTVYDTACTSYNFNGTILNTSGTYSATLTNKAGCDSAVTLHLIIIQPTTSSQTQTACGSYSFGGQTLTASGTYYATLLNAAGCDSVVTLNLTIVHSVTLGSITASANSNGTSLVQWTTLAETGNSGFEVQRSTDSLTWSNLSYVNTQAQNGNSSTTLNYTFEDYYPLIGYKNYYRLQETDCNGNIMYSPVVYTWFDNIPIKMHPNPATNSTVTVSGLLGYEELRVIDASGKTISVQNATGTSTEVNLSGVAPGIFFIYVKTMNGIVYLKGIKIN